MTSREQGTARPSPDESRPSRARRPDARPNAVKRSGDAPVRGTPGTLQRLQMAAGNAAVAGWLARTGGPPVQRRDLAGGGIPPPPVPPSPPVPGEHPGLVAVTKRLGAAGSVTSKHPPAKAETEAAQNAAKAPPDDALAQAKEAKAAELGATKPGTFDKVAFVAAVNKAIAAAAPQNLDEADKFAASGKSDTIAAQVKGNVTASKGEAAKPLADSAAAPPDTALAKERPVTPLAPTPPPPPVPAIDAGQAMPAKAPAEQTNLDAGPAEVDQKMADAKVTEEQLAKSNEPEFAAAVAAKKEGEAHSESAPAAFRDSEAAKLQAASAGAQADGRQTAAGLVSTKAQANQQVGAAQQTTQGKNQEEQARVAANINRIFDATKADVDKILGDLDGTVSKQFEEGERLAKAAFTAEHKRRMDAYKDERYSGALGWARWGRDLFAGLPAEANAVYIEAKKVYESQMQTLIGQIADTVGTQLQRAKARVAAGRGEIAAYVNSLSPALKSLGQKAAGDIEEKFGELESSIDEKSSSLAEDLAGKYVEARNAVDEEITAMQEANKGLWDKAKDAIGGAIETILKLKDMLLGVLARAAGAVQKIIADPIGFLSNFVNAVKTGVMNFGSNILTHLKKGLQDWLFGALAEAGIEIPETFDLKGIIKLVLSLLGLTWNAIRARIVKVIPEPVMQVIETSVEFVKVLISEGIPGLWKWIAAKLTDLKETVMAQIEDFVVTKVITAGLTWLISLLNPAAAFIKACKMIYDAVMWFVDNAARLKDFVDSVLDSVESIAAGGVGAVASLIENTLAKAVPMVISGLASLLGLGGIAEKIKGILAKIQKPVMSVVDKLIATAVKFGKSILKKLGRKGKETSPEDLAKHQQVGNQAVTEMTAGSESLDFPAFTARARQIEQQLGPQIRPGASLKVVLSAPHAEGDHAVDPFNIVIAPNTTTVAGEAKLQAGAPEATASLKMPAGRKKSGLIRRTRRRGLL